MIPSLRGELASTILFSRYSKLILKDLQLIIFLVCFISQSVYRKTPLAIIRSFGLLSKGIPVNQNFFAKSSPRLEISGANSWVKWRRRVSVEGQNQNRC